MKHFIFFLLFFFTLEVNAQYNWNSVPPTPSMGGPYKANVFDLAIGTYSSITRIWNANGSGLYLSDDNAYTWTKVSSFTYGTPTALDCLPSSAQWVVVGSDNGHIYRRETDGGQCLDAVNVGDNRSIYRIRFSTANPQYVWAGLYHGSYLTSALYRSIDAGATWNQDTLLFFYNTNTNIRDILTDPTDNQKVFVCGAATGTGTNKGIWRTYNGGTVSWTQVYSTYPITALGRKIESTQPPKTWIFGGGINRIVRSSDDGQTWSSVSITNADTIRSIVARTDINNIYAVGDNGVYYSTDFGAHWYQLNGQSSGSFLYDYTARDIVIDPSAQTTMYVGTASTVFKTTDAGLTWISYCSSIASKDISTVNPRYDTLVTGSFYEDAISTYDKTSWFNRPIYGGGAATEPIVSLAQIADIPNTNIRIAVGSQESSTKAVIYKSENPFSYSQWTQVAISSSTAGDRFYGVLVDPKDNQTLFAYGDSYDAGVYKNYYRSANLGNNWVSNKIPITGTYSCRSMVAIKNSQHSYADTLFAGFESQGIWKTMDGGVTWSQVLTSKYVFALGLNQTSPFTIYAGGRPPTDGYSLWKSTTGGGSGNWQNVNTPIKQTNPSGKDTVKCILMDPRTPNSGDYLFIIARENGGTDKLWRTADGGITWYDLTGNLNAPIRDIKFDANYTNILYVATSTGCLKAELLPEILTLVAPANNAANQLYCSANFSWNAVNGANSYHIQISTNSNFTNLVVNQSNLTGTTYSTNLSWNTTYYWRVAGNNSFGDEWSASRLFTTLARYTPSTPSLTYPPDQATNIPTYITFTWNVVTGATKYRIQISKYSDFSTLKDDAYTPATSIDRCCFGYLTDYYWRVKSLTCVDSSVWSSTFHFTTEPDPCPGCPPDKTIHAQEDELVSPSSFRLAQNHPNPFNPTTRLDYALSQDVLVSLKVYNVLGQVVATLVDEFQTAGYRTVEFNASQLPSGLYFYRLTAGKFIDIKKMILMK